MPDNKCVRLSLRPGVHRRRCMGLTWQQLPRHWAQEGQQPSHCIFVPSIYISYIKYYIFYLISYIVTRWLFDAYAYMMDNSLSLSLYIYITSHTYIYIYITTGQRVERSRGPKVQRSKGPKVQGSKGPKVQGPKYIYIHTCI